MRVQRMGLFFHLGYWANRANSRWTVARVVGLIAYAVKLAVGGEVATVAGSRWTVAKVADGGGKRARLQMLCACICGHADEDVGGPG